MLRLQEGERLHAFNDRAPTDGAAASALLLQCGQGAADRGEVQDLVIKIRQALSNALPDLMLRSATILELQQFGNVIQRETQRLGLADELQPLDVSVAVEPVASVGSMCGVQQALTLVVANGFDGDTGLASGISDFVRAHTDPQEGGADCFAMMLDSIAGFRVYATPIATNAPQYETGG